MTQSPYRAADADIESALLTTREQLRLAEERESALEQQLELAAGRRRGRGRLVGWVVVAALSALLGVAIGTGLTRAKLAAMETRFLSLKSVELDMTRQTDGRLCTLRFERTTTVRYGNRVAACDTKITCAASGSADTVLYAGLAQCADHRHLIDDVPADGDGDGQIRVDLLQGTASVDSAHFRF